MATERDHDDGDADDYHKYQFLRKLRFVYSSSLA